MAGDGDDAAAAGAAAAFAPPSRWLTMSLLVTRPAAPVPGTWVRSTLLSFAILRTSGEERTLSPSAADAAGAAATGAAAGAATAGAAFAAGAPAAPPMTAATGVICTR